ncbi:hypothetical protein VP01_430g2 [Puccinia sorghi]|uniref:PNPLA domain-containing protein n=1 Tax=Puccinia sorghi TaxID=27349 RepID=A0A0L6UQ27_9BASI|nr:hypothetical protein VP01_430g2 [Puccinia sorghi]
MSNENIPPFLQSVLALRPPLATSTRTNLAPSFQLLQSIVNSVYGTSPLRGIEPGLWRAQLIRATLRAAQLIQAVWTKLGGKEGVILDDQGEDGRGVMRLQGVFSDIQMFVGSLTTLQDPLVTLLLDPLAFSRTQATVTTINKKLASLITHYEVSDLLPTPLDQWQDEDAQDKSEDLGALPLLIAKSRPTKAVLQKFEADCVQREQTAISAPDQQDVASANPNNAASSSATPAAPLTPSPSSFASSGLSSAKRPEFLRFVYSQNPHLIANNETLDTAVAAGSAALSSMSTTKPKSHSTSKGLGVPQSSKSLVQQRISSFAASGNAALPLPASAAASFPVRRSISDNPQALSALNWKPSISRSASIKSRSSMSGDVSDLNNNAACFFLGNASVTDQASSADLDSTPKSTAPPTFAEQAAAIVAARKQRTISQSSVSTLPKDRLQNKGVGDAASSTGLPITREHASLPGIETSSISSVSVAKLPASLNSDVPSHSGCSSPSSIHPLPSTNTTTVTTISQSSSKPLDSAPPPSTASSVPVATSSPPPMTTRMNSISSATFPKPSTSTMSPRSNHSLPSSPPPQSLRRPSLAPPEPDLDFELVSDLIEHTSMLDVILAPAPDDAESITLSSSLTIDSSAPEPANLDLSEQSSASMPQEILSTLTNTMPDEELSLNDLMEQASMFESWTPDRHDENTHLSPIDTSSPAHPSSQDESAPQSTAFRSPTLSTTSSSSPPPSSGLTLESDEKALSLKATSLVSHRPAHLALHPPPSKLIGSMPEAVRSEAVLTIAGSHPSTPSISGQSWATSFVLSPRAPLESDWNLLHGNYYQTQFSVCLPPPQNPLKSGWRILSLDGGGIRGLSMLFVVRELMSSIQTCLRLQKAPLPCEIFEMICGVGTGGIIALLLGRLRLDVAVAIEAYLQIVTRVFRQSKGVIAAVRRKTRFSATKLEAVTREVVKRISGHEELDLADPSDANPLCRTFVIATRTMESKTTMSKLKSYDVRQMPGVGCSIAQAARATSAAPLFFKAAPAQEVDMEAEPVVTSETSLNNPTLEAVKEAQTLYPGRPIDCLVSLGAGKGVHDGSGSIARACVEMAQSSAQTAREVEAKARQQGWASNYFRLAVTGLKNEDNRGEWENPDWVKAGTVKYLFIDQLTQFDLQTDCLVKSWKSCYDEQALQQILQDHSKGVEVPRSAFLPTRSQGLASRGEDLRRSISADHASEMQGSKGGGGKALVEGSGSMRMSTSRVSHQTSSHSVAAGRTPHILSHSTSHIIPHYPASLFEGSTGPYRPPESDNLATLPALHHQPDPLDLKLPEFNFSKT